MIIVIRACIAAARFTVEHKQFDASDHLEFLRGRYDGPPPIEDFKPRCECRVTHESQKSSKIAERHVGNSLKMSVVSKSRSCNDAVVAGR